MTLLTSLETHYSSHKSEEADSKMTGKKETVVPVFTGRYVTMAPFYWQWQMPRHLLLVGCSSQARIWTAPDWGSQSCVLDMIVSNYPLSLTLHYAQPRVGKTSRIKSSLNFQFLCNTPMYNNGFPIKKKYHKAHSVRVKTTEIPSLSHGICPIWKILKEN